MWINAESCPFTTRHTALRIGRIQASLLVQIVQSATAFIIALSLIPPLGPSEYGVFALGVSVQMFALSIVDSLLTVPITVAAGRYGTRVAGRYVSVLLPAVLVFSVMASMAVIALVLAGSSALDVPEGQRLGFALVVGAGTLAVSLRESVRMLLLVERRLPSMIAVDVLASAASILTLYVLLVPAKQHLNGSTALLTLATPVIVYCLSLAILPLHPIRLRRIGLILHLVRSGSRSLGASMLSWVQSQSYIYFVATLLGAAALGSLSAVRAVFAPLQTLFTGVAKGIMPGLARRISVGEDLSFQRILTRSYQFSGLLVFVWTGLAALGAETVFAAIGARHFHFDLAMVVSWGTVFLITALRSVSSVGLRSMARFGDLVWQGLIGALVAMVSIPSLILQAGAVGALWGLSLAELAAWLFSLRLLTRRAQCGR